MSCTINCCWCGEAIEFSWKVLEVKFSGSKVHLTPETKSQYSTSITIDHTCNSKNEFDKELNS